MNQNQPMTQTTFIQRLTGLLLRSGLSGFPKDELSRQILLKSAALTLGRPGQTYSESEINALLDGWVKQISQIKALDRVTMRRALVDQGYLIRAADGSSYQVAQPPALAGLFEARIDELDAAAEMAAAREETARRKREFIEKSKGA